MPDDKEKLRARMAGAKAALEGKKMDANTYPEENDLHFEWLAGWSAVKAEQARIREELFRYPKKQHDATTDPTPVR